MIQSLPAKPRQRPAADAPRALYRRLLADTHDPTVHVAAANFLACQLETARQLPCELPDDPGTLDAWLLGRSQAVGAQFQAYLAERRAGAPRRYFPGKAQALHFLRGVAPTKLVDGAWLYGLLAHWQDARLRALIDTYLEELGEGEPGLNHVRLYRQLLASHGCQHWQNLPPAHFIQGAIQLALAECTPTHLPEVIGFNLGYEQLPLHLLISAHELAELDIDPYYFTLHVTVDNAHGGHAHKALGALREAWPRVGEPARFYQRVRDGYRLNELGVGTLAVIDSFDAEAEVIGLLKDKCAVASQVHASGCRFEGKTLNQWLADPAQIPAFVSLLQQRGWIRRHAEAAQSRFWRLLEGERAPMFGAFDAYEREMLRCWIEDERYAEGFPARAPRRLPQAARPSGAAPVTGADDFDEDERLLAAEIAALPTPAARLQRLIPLLGPAHHHSPVGLLATRLFRHALDAPHGCA